MVVRAKYPGAVLHAHHQFRIGVGGQREGELRQHEIQDRTRLVEAITVDLKVRRVRRKAMDVGRCSCSEARLLIGGKAVC